jgi:ABC-type lipoprotein release transport system permease subunit
MLGWATIYQSFVVPIYISGSTVFFIYAIIIIPILFATVVPAWINATVDPDIAMRGAKV